MILQLEQCLSQPKIKSTKGRKKKCKPIIEETNTALVAIKLKPPSDPEAPGSWAIDPKKLQTIGKRKQLHIAIHDDMRTELKIACARKKITMQDFFVECIACFIDGNEEIEKIIDELSKAIHNKTIKRVNAVDEDAVYRAINGE